MEVYVNNYENIVSSAELMQNEHYFDRSFAPWMVLPNAPVVIN
jgi:hypothetical protein